MTQSTSSTTTTSTPPVKTLADIFAQVQVTPSQGIQVLNTLAEENEDKDPGLATALDTAIANLSTMTTAADETSSASRK